MRPDVSRIVTALIRSAAAGAADGDPFMLARRHKLSGLVAAALADADHDRVPPARRAEAEVLLQRVRHDGARLIPELLCVAEALAAKGIRALTLKGPAQSALLHGEPTLRPSLDLDLLIDPADREPAVAELERLGYVARPPADGLSREIHLINARRNFVLDLHWNVVGGEVPFALDFEALWAERQEVELGGGRVALPSNAWLAVLTSLYLIKEYPRLELVYLADLERLAARLSAKDRARAAEIAAATGTRRILALAFALLEARGIAAPSPVPADAAVAPLLGRIERALADPGNTHKQRYRHRLAMLLSHAAFRERLADRLRVALALPSFLLRPDMEDIEQATAAGRSPAWARLRRLPEVAADLLARRPDPHAARHAALADPAARLTASPGIELHLLDDAGLLFDPAAGEILALSTSAAFIWCALEERMTLGEIESAYARNFGRDARTAAAEVRGALGQWLERGLLGDTPRVARAEPVAAAPLPPLPQRAVPRGGVVRRVRILDVGFDLTVESEAQAHAIDQVLGHFASPADAAPAVPVTLATESGSTVLRVEGELVDQVPDARGVVPMVKHALVAEAVNRHGFALYVHGAMLRHRDAALLLPAAPGSGKSCLSLALAAAGLSWHTDEMVLLDGAELRARGVPACPCLKQPAWELMAPLVPGLAALPVHRRADGKLVRYPPPPVDMADPALATAWPVRWLVFPRYTAEGPAGLVRLDRVEALRRLLAETPAMRVALDAAFTRRLVAWIAGIECYALEFDGFDAAITALRGLVGQRQPEPCPV